MDDYLAKEIIPKTLYKSEQESTLKTTDKEKCLDMMKKDYQDLKYGVEDKAIDVDDATVTVEPEVDYEKEFEKAFAKFYRMREMADKERDKRNFKIQYRDDLSKKDLEKYNEEREEAYHDIFRESNNGIWESQIDNYAFKLEKCSTFNRNAIARCFCRIKSALDGTDGVYYESPVIVSWRDLKPERSSYDDERVVATVVVGRNESDKIPSVGWYTRNTYAVESDSHIDYIGPSVTTNLVDICLRTDGIAILDDSLFKYYGYTFKEKISPLYWVYKKFVKELIGFRLISKEPLNIDKFCDEFIAIESEKQKKEIAAAKKLNGEGREKVKVLSKDKIKPEN